MSKFRAASADHGAAARTDSGALMQMICRLITVAAATSGVSLLIIPVCPQLKASLHGRRRLCCVLKRFGVSPAQLSEEKGKTKEAQNPSMQIQNTNPGFRNLVIMEFCSILFILRPVIRALLLILIISIG